MIRINTLLVNMKTAEFVGKVMKERRITIPKHVMEILGAEVGDLVKVVIKINGGE